MAKKKAKRGNRDCPRCGKLRLESERDRLCESCRSPIGKLAEVASQIKLMSANEARGAHPDVLRTAENLEHNDCWCRIRDWARTEWHPTFDDGEILQAVIDRLKAIYRCDENGALGMPLSKIEKVLKQSATKSHLSKPKVPSKTDEKEETPHDEEPKLNAKHIKCLKCLRSLRAKSATSRKTRDVVGKCVDNPFGNATTVAEELAFLAKLGYVDSLKNRPRKGMPGGCFITADGLAQLKLEEAMQNASREGWKCR